jgi:EmrB/QacA subfamily drug resistance transporter
MLLIDIMIVQVALPTIHRQVGGGFTDLQWVIDAYALTLAAFILTFGSIADRVGRKRVFIGGVVVFTLASLLCGAANGIDLLIAARALQGVGGAAMFATGLALIGQEFQGRERGRAIAVWGATVGFAVAAGPLAGGVLTDAVGWRWIFLVNGPIGLATVLVAAPQMVNVKDRCARRLDWAGLITFSGALFAAMFALMRGTELGWGSRPIGALFAGALLLITTFVVVELRHPQPMLDLALFRKPAFVGVSVATLAIGVGLFAVFPYLTLYLQNDLGYSPLTGGLCLLPSTVLIFVVPLATRSLVERLSPGVVLAAGLTVSAAGLGAMHGLTVGSTWTALVPGLLLTGLGIGLANPAIARIALGVVPPWRAGMASGISNTFRIGGLATGVAVLGIVFQDHLARASGTHGGTHGASHEAFVSGVNVILVIGAALVAVGAVAALVLVRSRDFHESPTAQPRDLAPQPC